MGLLLRFPLYQREMLRALPSVVLGWRHMSPWLASIMSASVTSSLRVVENSLAAEFVMMNAPQHHILLWIDLKSGKFIVRFAALGKQSQMNASTATYNLVNITATFVTYG
mmetsp:Transcript_21609/g.30269  ORF Transcript_21609/g.30269 Transcript_21609/m.30269 type:complete len:110 (+) Transcript_21609:516-845(+)